MISVLPTLEGKVKGTVRGMVGFPVVGPMTVVTVETGEVAPAARYSTGPMLPMSYISPAPMRTDVLPSPRTSQASPTRGLKPSSDGFFSGGPGVVAVSVAGLRKAALKP